jgi:hypothetical protein
MQRHNLVGWLWGGRRILLALALAAVSLSSLDHFPAAAQQPAKSATTTGSMRVQVLDAAGQPLALRLPDLRIRGGHAIVSRHGQLQSSAKRRSMDGHHHRHPAAAVLAGDLV